MNHLPHQLLVYCLRPQTRPSAQALTLPPERSSLKPSPNFIIANSAAGPPFILVASYTCELIWRAHSGRWSCWVTWAFASDKCFLGLLYLKAFQQRDQNGVVPIFILLPSPHQPSLHSSHLPHIYIPRCLTSPPIIYPAKCLSIHPSLHPCKRL